jgi:hypothetical protein
VDREAGVHRENLPADEDGIGRRLGARGEQGRAEEQAEA